MEFHEKLQELRKSRGLTQEELAEALFVSRTAISKWESGDSRPPYREWQSQQSCLWKQKTPGNSPGSGRRAALGEFLSVWQARSCGQAGSSIASPLLRRRSTKYCGLHTPAERLPEAGFHCGRYHAFPGSALLAGHIHRKAFRHSGKQRRQPQTAAGFAVQS